MKRDLLRILFISAISGLVIITGVYLFLKPASIGDFDLTEKDKLGAAISGLTAPVIGLISTVLLYLALSKQTESNNEQRLKNESDMIFMLLSQLDSEINAFRTTEILEWNTANGKESVTRTDTGYEGLDKFCSRYRPSEADNLEPMDEGYIKFEEHVESRQIMLIITSYILVEKRIQIANLSDDLKQMFNSKLVAYYKLKLRDPFGSLIYEMQKHKAEPDWLSGVVEKFVNQMR